MRNHLWRRFVAGCFLWLGPLGLPHHAIAAQPVVIWWNQGFYPAEDQAMRDTVAAWEKQTGNKVELTFYNGADLPAKIISAMTTGEVPDICYADTNDLLLLPQAAWNGRALEVGDVVNTQKDQYSPTALAAAGLLNQKEQKRGFYGVPLKQQALHYFVWIPMVAKAGFAAEQIPKTWGEYFSFFEQIQKKLREKGQRVYGLGYSVATKDTDSSYLFNQFLVAYGGGQIVTPDGKLHTDDPKVREAAIKALTELTAPYKGGFVPPGAINWGDPDNNSAFYAKQIVMTPNASLSIPVAQAEKTEQYQHEILTEPQPLGPDGKPVTSLVSIKMAFVPNGARNAAGAKDFLKYLIQPKVLDAYLVSARGRWVPVMPALAKTDPFWTDPNDPHRPVATRQELEGPTAPWFQVYNPAYADVNAEQVWGKAEANVMQGGMTPAQAVDGALAQINAIFAKYPLPPG